MTYVFTRDVDDLSGGARQAGGAGQPHSILASLALEDARVSAPAATDRPHRQRGTKPAPTFSPGLPLSPLGPCKEKGAWVSFPRGGAFGGRGALGQCPPADGDGAGSSTSIPRVWWAPSRAAAEGTGGFWLLGAEIYTEMGPGACSYLRSGEALQARAAIHAGHASVPLEQASGQGEMQAQHPHGIPRRPPQHPAPTFGPGKPGCPGLPTSPLIPGSPGTPCRTHGQGDVSAQRPAGSEGREGARRPQVT